MILTAACLINLCLGSIYAWSVFASSMAVYLTETVGQEITTGDLAIVYTIANAVGPITMISGGWFNDRLDATAAFKIVGAAFLIIILVSTLFMEQCPDGYLPEGFTPPKRQAGTGSMNWKQMMSTPAFYIMLLLLTCGAFSGMMVISQASAVAQNMIEMTAMAASAAVSILALFNALGRILAGYISDKIGRINTLMAACVLSIVGLLCLYISGAGSMVTFYLGISVVGISFGSFMGVYPGFTADQFGAKNKSVNYGIMFIGFAQAGFFGPQIMRNVYSAAGAYQNAFLIACGLSVAGVVLIFLYRAVSKKRV